MRARREIEAGLKTLRRERGKLAALVRAFDTAVFGDDDYHTEVERISKLDIRATNEPAPKPVARKYPRSVWSWAKRYGR